SKVLLTAFNSLKLPVSVKVDKSTPLDTVGGRYLLSLLRLQNDINDSFAWRTLLMNIRKGNRLGPTAITEISDYARSNSLRIGEAVLSLEAAPELLKCGKQISSEVVAVKGLLSKLSTDEKL